MDDSPYSNRNSVDLSDASISTQGPGIRRHGWFAFATTILMLTLTTQPGYAGSDRITVVGSSTVYPFSAVVAEHFARSGPFPAPVVRATSTAEGFRLFCSGVGDET